MPQDLNDASPTSFNHIIGQKTVIDQLVVALSACWEDHRRLDDALLVGPPGLGKSQIATVIGHELATTVHEALGQSIKSVSDLNALLLAAGDKEVVFIDEVHELSKTFQTTLYLCLDKRKILVRSGSSYSSIPLADFTLLLGTTDEYLLLQPLRDRMRLLLRFEFYSHEELAKIVTHRAKALKWDIDDQLPPTDRAAWARNSPSRPAPPASLPQGLPLRRARQNHPRPSKTGLRAGASGRPWLGAGGAAIPPNPCGRGEPPERRRLDAGAAGTDGERGSRAVPSPCRADRERRRRQA